MLVEKMKVRMSPCGLLFLWATYIGIFSITICQSTCPTRCLCHLDEQPRAIICSKQGLEEFPENISDIVEQLNLSNNLLTDIRNGDINRLVDLQYLNLARNKLESLPDNLYSLKNLRSLDLSGNKIYTSAHISSIKQLSSLTDLQLSRNPLLDFDKLVSSSIAVLDASHCEIRMLSNTSLEGLLALNSLNLTGNPLEVINNVRNPTLHSLDMSNCRLSFYSYNIFSGLPNLEELDLSNNPELSQSIMYTNAENYLNLKKLDISGCNLDEPVVLNAFPSLTHVRLSHNRIHMLPERFFVENRELRFLYLDANDIKYLDISTFEGLVKLQILDLSANNLEVIHPLTFRDNVQLKLLNLSYNNLYEFPNLTSTVMLLDVSYNIISNLNRNFLTNMPKIRSINFSDNNLQRIPSGLKSTTLRNLELHGNRIIDLPIDTFLHFPQLITIDLSGNQLTEAIDPMIFRNNPNINIIKLEDNPWRCDCKKLFFLHSFLTELPAKSNDQSLFCESPANVSGYTWVTACINIWNKPSYTNKDRTWGFVMISLLMMILLFGSFVSVRHMMRVKRRAIEQRERLESLRLLRRTRPQSERVQEERIESVTQPRVHPLESVGPPSYEEAVRMPRISQSLGNLDEISVDMSSTRNMGSVDNIRYKPKRMRRTKRRIQSDNNLFERGKRRHGRIRRERNNLIGNKDTDLPESQRNLEPYATRRARRQSMISNSMDSTSGRTMRSTSQTLSTGKKRRAHTVYDSHSSDDEDSDQPVGSSRSIVIRELRREPKSGYRESATEMES